MTNNRELYNQIQNPLDNDETLQLFLECYQQNHGDIPYNYIVGATYMNQRLTLDWDKQSELMAFLLNRSRARGGIKNPYGIPTINYFIKTLPDPVPKDFFTRPEVLVNLRDVFAYSDSMDELVVHPHVLKPWQGIGSSDHDEIHHRLYLNVKAEDEIDMAMKFVEKCDQKDLPIELKFFRLDSDRRDSFVIYVPGEELSSYIDMLREIKEENPSLVAKVGEPPIFTGNIDGWIGYGSEKIDSYESSSYHAERLKVINDSITDVLRSYVKENLETQISNPDTNQTISVRDYFTKNLKNQVVEQKRRYTNLDSKTSQEIDSAIEQSLEELLSDEFKEKSYQTESMTFQLNRFHIRSAIADVISKCDIDLSKFLPNIKKEIKANAIIRGMDPDKICFDVENRDLLFARDNSEKELQAEDSPKVLIYSDKNNSSNQS